MKYMRTLPYIGFLLALSGTFLAADARAQTQKGDHPYQKSPEREQFNEEPSPQGGYQAPPPTGALQGPTRELGLSGGEIEFPALRLRLPRVRLPALTMFLTPPQMQMEPGVAPLVQQVQEQVSVPAGKTEAATEPFREREAEPEQFREPSEAFQKTGYDPIPSPAVNPADMAWMKSEMDQFEQRMDQKLASLTQSIELLVAERRSRAADPVRSSRTPDLVPLPVTEESEESHVCPSAYLSLEPILRVVKDAPELRRLPAN